MSMTVSYSFRDVSSASSRHYMLAYMCRYVGYGDLDDHDHHLLSKSLIEIKGTMKSTEIPDSLKKAFDGFQNITKAEQLATKQQLLEKLPSLLRKEKVSVPASVNILHQTFVTQGLKTCCLSLPRY